MPLLPESTQSRPCPPSPLALPKALPQITLDNLEHCSKPFTGNSDCETPKSHPECDVLNEAINKSVCSRYVGHWD